MGRKEKEGKGAGPPETSRFEARPGTRGGCMPDLMRGKNVLGKAGPRRGAGGTMRTPWYLLRAPCPLHSGPATRICWS